MSSTLAKYVGNAILQTKEYNLHCVAGEARMLYYLQVAMKALQSPVAIYYFLGVFWTNVNTCLNRLLHV